ncbi:MAG: prolipoprotein diacylglyceryl transferase [Parcubacteria group bacterium]|nr:prolipoprotein diacylglyceryl transferase [Parcubacteria group bacterium]
MIPYHPIHEIPLGPISIKTWGLMVALGFLVALLVGIVETKRHQIKPDHMYNIMLLGIIFGLLGGRLLYIIIHWSHYSQNLVDIFKLWEGGAIFYGGFALAAAAIYYYIRKHKLSFWRIADITAISMAAGIFVGRIGCYLIGDHMGKVTDFITGVTYFGEIRHNTAMYSSLVGLIFFLVIWPLRKKIKMPGVIFSLFLIWYSITRFFIDHLRDFDLRIYGLTGSQYLSVVILVMGVWLLIARTRLKEIGYKDKGS